MTLQNFMVLAAAVVIGCMFAEAWMAEYVWTVGP